MSERDKIGLADIHYVKLVSIGSVNPAVPLSEEAKAQQMVLLNRCLNQAPKGIIIGKDIAVGSYRIGEHEFTMEKVTYHIGFARKPNWENGQGTV